MSHGLQLLRIDTRKADVRQQLADLRERLSPRGNIVSEAGRKRTIEVFDQPLSPQEVVQKICDDVRTKGLQAVLDYSARIDKAELTADTIRVTTAELSAAHAAADKEFLNSVRRIRQNVLRFQQAILEKDVRVDLPDGGGYLRQRYLPLSRVGICVPGGAAAYPSTVLMTAVPAQAAGVKQLAIVAPPTKFGAYNPDLLATCHELGVTEVYRLGGAQAVAALAYGIEGLPKVDKIVGPGNLFVALAKRHVYGEVDIDSIAGPSEVVVVADETARPDFTAADLIAQAETPLAPESLSPGTDPSLTPWLQNSKSKPHIYRAAIWPATASNNSACAHFSATPPKPASWPTKSPPSICTLLPPMLKRLWKKFRMLERRFWVISVPSPQAIMPPVHRTFCRPAAPPASLPASPPTTLCAAAALSP